MTVDSGTSPAASGPAGSYFEGKVGAYYLLSLLAGAETHGFPEMRIERVAWQQGGAGSSLDDVVVHGRLAEGEAGVLEIQAKRSVRFSPKDPVFKKVAVQIGKAGSTLDFSCRSRRFAIACDKATTAIAGPCQDVLRWAGEIDSAAAFFAQLSLRGASNANMRAFVETFRRHLSLDEAGGDESDERVWELLRRLQILVFDFDAPGSSAEALVRERAIRVLAPEQDDRADLLWRALVDRAVDGATSAGSIERGMLTDHLVRLSFRLAGSRRNAPAREYLGEMSYHALLDLEGHIAGGSVILERKALLAAIRDSRDRGGRYLEILGGAGVGKSGILAVLIGEARENGHPFVLSPGRTPPGGWSSLRTALEVNGSARAFLSDLVAGGGATIFIDGLDAFVDSGERQTVADVVQEAVRVPGCRIIVTARTGFDRDGGNWLPAKALERLKRSAPITVGPLDDADVRELREKAPALAPLLDDDHPARRLLARNLFRLRRLSERSAGAADVYTEVDLALQWWETGDGADGERRQRCRRLLARLAEAVLVGENGIVIECESEAVFWLRDRGSIEIERFEPGRLLFAHDILRDWAVAAYLHEHPVALDRLTFDAPLPSYLASAVELTARIRLERTGSGKT